MLAIDFLVRAKQSKTKITKLIAEDDSYDNKLKFLSNIKTFLTDICNNSTVKIENSGNTLVYRSNSTIGWSAIYWVDGLQQIEACSSVFQMLSFLMFTTRTICVLETKNRL